LLQLELAKWLDYPVDFGQPMSCCESIFSSYKSSVTNKEIVEHSEIVHLWKEKSLLAAARQAVITSRVKKVKESKELTTAESDAEKVEVARIAAAEKRINNSALIQFGYAPLTMHWSLESGILPDPVWVGIFGTLSAWFSLVGTWRATA
jgi:hypothetical protein